MKSNKHYINTAITTQMIIVPIILTISFIAGASLLNGFLKPSDLGINGVRFLHTLIAFTSALFIGGTVGFIFSRYAKEKPDREKVRYLTPLVPIIFALVLAILAFLFSKGNYNSPWWGIYAFKNPVLIVLNFILAFAGVPHIMPIAELSGYIGFAGGMLLHEQVSKTAIKNNVGRNFKMVYAGLFAAFILFTYINTYDVINNGIIELRYGQSTLGKDLTEFDLMRIAPFKENNGLAKLEGKTTLQFTDLEDMPRLDGATAAYPVYAAFVEAVYQGLGDYYEGNKNNHEKDMYTAFVASEDYPLNIIQCSKTSEAYEKLIQGKTDIIFVAEPSKAHVEKIRTQGDEFVLTPIGSEAFVFFTNTDNPVETLTIQQIQDIYSGKIKNWKEVGGQNRSILPYQRPENSGSQTIMQNKVMKDIEMLLPTKETYAGGMGDIISQVASYKNARNAVGYSFMYYSSSMIKNNQIKYISIDGVKPTPETVRNKDYPFTVPVYAVTLKSNTNKNVDRLIQWILSDEGQRLVEKTGYVSTK